MEGLILPVFLFFFFLDYAIDLALNELNLRHVAASLPRRRREWKEAGQEFPEQEARAIAYRLERGRFSRVRMLTLVPWRLAEVFLFLPPLLAAARAWSAGLPRWLEAEALLFILGLGALNRLRALPFELYDDFVIEERWGFQRSSFGLWLADELKGLALGLAVGVPALVVAFRLVALVGPLWWLWAWVLLMLLQLVMLHVYPAWIAPLFNDFTPLPEGEVRNRTLALARRVGFEVERILVKDASRRSTHSNAYFYGFGRAKRIVFYDTLLAELSPEQNEAVLAHELGHWKLGHGLKWSAWGSFASLFDLYVVGLALGFPSLCAAFGVPHSPHAVFYLYGVVASRIFFIRGPIENLVSRRAERSADLFAREALGGDGKAGAEALHRLAVQNLGNVEPHPWYHAYYSSHPTLAEREAALGAAS